MSTLRVRCPRTGDWCPPRKDEREVDVCSEPGCKAEALCAKHEERRRIVRYLVDMGYESAAFLITSSEQR